jgi:hypothetical protein
MLITLGIEPDARSSILIMPCSTRLASHLSTDDLHTPARRAISGLLMQHEPCARTSSPITFGTLRVGSSRHARAIGCSTSPMFIFILLPLFMAIDEGCLTA